MGNHGDFMIEKILEIGNLFDFYGKLLSEKQYTAVELYYIQDLSLSEIGDCLGISRQGAHDNLKRAESKLYSYEETLGLVKKFEDNKTKIRKILEITGDLENKARKFESEDMAEELQKIKEISSEIVD